MNRKIAIITLNGYFNYGNRLQNFALQNAIESLGFDVETIINTTKLKKNTSSRIQKIKSKSMADIFRILKYKLNNILYKEEYINSRKIRTEIFKEFSHNYICETDYNVSQNNMPADLSDRYAYFVAGSDQVWNPDYICDSSINFLTFAEYKKRITYAPSFGVSKIPQGYISNYKKWLSGIHKLSVREDDGAKIIKNLTGRQAPVLLDPTLLLTKEEWLSVSRKATNKPAGKYLATYFLGNLPYSYKKHIKYIAKKNNLQVVNLYDISEKEAYRTGPSEFIDYINSCSLFCTNSYHGSIFSILMEKPFIVYQRKNTSPSMYSRIETLLSKFKLEDRKYENIKSDNDIFSIDYSHVSEILEKERNKSYNYLKDAFNQ
jgi:hypothetical protein